MVLYYFYWINSWNPADFTMKFGGFHVKSAKFHGHEICQISLPWNLLNFTWNLPNFTWNPPNFTSLNPRFGTLYPWFNAGRHICIQHLSFTGLIHEIQCRFHGEIRQISWQGLRYISVLVIQHFSSHEIRRISWNPPNFMAMKSAGFCIPKWAKDQWSYFLVFPVEIMTLDL